MDVSIPRELRAARLGAEATRPKMNSGARDGVKKGLGVARLPATAKPRACSDREWIFHKGVRRGTWAGFRLAVVIDEGGEGIRVVGMPAAEHRAVLDDVAHGPGHAFFVELAGNVVVGAKNVEITAA